MQVEQFKTIDDLIESGAAAIAESMQDAISSRGKFLIALSGGNTPRPVYRRLTEPPYRDSLSWIDTHVYFGDERIVPPDSPESNFRMAQEALLSRIEIPAANVHRIQGELSPAAAATAYNVELRQLAGPDSANLPRFDLMLQGLGPDGHTASLFPGTPVLENVVDFAVAVHLAENSVGARDASDRVTMTYRVLNNARHVLFLVAGADKADALRRVEAGDQSAPAARVIPTNGTVRWLVVRD